MVSSVQGRKKGEGQRTLSLQAWPLAPASSVRAGSLACPKTHHGPRGKRVLCLALMNQNSSLTAGLRICPPGKMGSLPTPVGSTEQEVEGYWVGNGQDVLYLKGIDSNFGVYKMGTLTPPIPWLDTCQVPVLLACPVLSALVKRTLDRAD